MGIGGSGKREELQERRKQRRYYVTVSGVLSSLRQEDHEFQPSLGFMVSLRVWTQNENVTRIQLNSPALTTSNAQDSASLSQRLQRLGQLA